MEQNAYGAEGLMCIDQWDWKTDAPEFVPVSMAALMGSPNDYGVNQCCSPDGNMYPTHGAWTMSPMPTQPNGQGGAGDSAMNANMPADNTRLGQLRAQFEWQHRMKAEALREMQTRMNQLEIETTQIKTSWEMERTNLMKQVKQHRAVLERYCIPLDEAGNSSYSEGQDEINGSYLSGFEASAASPWTDVSTAGSGNQGLVSGGGKMSGSYGGEGSADPSADAQTSSLDTKMRQLNSLLQEGKTHDQTHGASPDEPGVGHADGGTGTAGNAASGDAGAITSTLRAMFPHATIRTGQAQNGGDDREEANDQVQKKVEQQLEKLETLVGRQIDDRASRALQTLSRRDALEALGKVEELVNSQGGQCRNLSSILQSVCRKIEKRCSKGAKYDDEKSKQGLGYGAREGAGFGSQRGPGSNAAEGNRGGQLHRPSDASNVDVGGDSDGLGNDSGGSGRRPNSDEREPLRRGTSIESDNSKLNTPASRRSNNRRSWADIQSGDEEDPWDDSSDGNLVASTPANDAASGEQPPSRAEPWTLQRVEKAARRGLELRRRGGGEGGGGNAWGGWELKIAMSGLQPPLTEAGMERYCSWLRVRLSAFRDEHGAEALRRCRGEVDFSHNKLTDQMVWMLLETLAQHEVHIALLKLFANNISQGGVLAICEFIRMNERTDPMQELHLSHNEVDDESALELLRTFQFQVPRYPPRRAAEGTGEMALAPVWLRLNHNRVRDPTAVRKAAEAEGITICTASDRNVCGTSRCGQRQCPLVHLYSFDAQS